MATGTQTPTQAPAEQLDAALAKYRQAAAREAAACSMQRATEIARLSVPERAKAHAAWMAASQETTEALRALIVALGCEWVG